MHKLHMLIVFVFWDEIRKNTKKKIKDLSMGS